MDVPARTDTRRLHLDGALATVILALMAALPLLEAAVRQVTGGGVPGAGPLVQHFTLWIAFVGALVASRRDEMLALSTASFLPDGVKARVKVFTSSVAGVVCVLLATASVQLVQAERGGAETVALGIPVWVALLVMPVCYVVVGWRLLRHAGTRVLHQVLAAAPAVVTVLLVVADAREWLVITPASWMVWTGAVVILVATSLGMPMMATLGGLALLLFWKDGTPTAAVPVETYRLATQPLFPAIPLFTLCGYILSAGAASQRLVRLFTAWFGWMSGGTAVVTALVFAFFTSFTGASGVTILSLGGLLLPVLLRTGYGERFSLGLVTASGSIGLLFPPSLPVILYGVYAQVGIDKLFVGGALPGVIMVGAVAALGVYEGRRSPSGRTPFNWREARAALWESKWELLLPVVVMTGLLGGWATLVEAAALCCLYALVVERFIQRDTCFDEQIGKALEDCASLVGGVLIILGVALGLTNYLLDAQIPDRAVAWMELHVHSRALFLLMLNLALIVVGAAMDIFSAILVVVPLILPMGQAFGVDPVHLGIIFLSNLQLGYLMPPVGENLFLSAYRFGRPLVDVFRATVPFVLIILVVVLVVTYVPALTLGPVQLLSG
ncbi:MAG: TRAP transporter large permease subunit [Myxococcota bacterium]